VRVIKLQARVTSGMGTLRRAAGVRNCARSSSNLVLIALIAAAEKLWPQSSSVIALTFLVDAPWTYISASAATSAFSERC
jgi:hypothetical protein